MTALLTMTKLRQQLGLWSLWITWNRVHPVQVPYCVNEKKCYSKVQVLLEGVCVDHINLVLSNMATVEPAAEVYTCYSMAIERGTVTCIQIKHLCSGDMPSATVKSRHGAHRYFRLCFKFSQLAPSLSINHTLPRKRIALHALPILI